MISRRPLSRRSFLKIAAGSAGSAAGAVFPALLPAAALGRDGAVAPSNRLQLGVIGTNQGGFNWVRCNFPDVITVGVCDVDAGRRGSLTAGANHRHGGRVATGYADFREMFARAALDAVIIATPDHWHAPMAVAAARAGIAGIWGEKPLAHTLREGRAVVRAVNEHGTVWQTGSWQRSLPNFRRAVELVRAGVIGKVRRIEVVLHGYNFLDDVKAGEARGIGGERGKPPASLDYERWLGPAPWREYVPGVIHGNWRFCGDYGGGYLLDWIGHHFDIAQWGAGKDAEGPVRVAGSGVFEDGGRARGVEHYDAIRSYDFDCEYADGLVINVRGLPARRGHGMCGVTFRGENGRWIWCERGVPNRASHPEILTTNLGENATGNVYTATTIGGIGSTASRRAAPTPPLPPRRGTAPPVPDTSASPQCSPVAPCASTPSPSAFSTTPPPTPCSRQPSATVGGFE